MLLIDGISAGYDDSVVLRDVQVGVPPGRVVALIGANGAGKTTLLRVASGLLPARAGRVVLDGRDLTRTTPEQRAGEGICHIPEGRGVFPSLTVRDNLRLFCRAGDEDNGIARAVAAFPRLGERIGQLGGTLSGGEQQMLALSRAFVSQARYVLLDEVSMGLAPRVVDEIFDFLARLRAEGIALLLVEQYVTKALALADHVYSLSRGRIAFAGEPAELEGADVFASYLGAEIGAPAGPHAYTVH